jgi:hypothetical protein
MPNIKGNKVRALSEYGPHRTHILHSETGFFVQKINFFSRGKK